MGVEGNGGRHYLPTVGWLRRMKSLAAGGLPSTLQWPSNKAHPHPCSRHRQYLRSETGLKVDGGGECGVLDADGFAIGKGGRGWKG